MPVLSKNQKKKLKKQLKRAAGRAGVQGTKALTSSLASLSMMAAGGLGGPGSAAAAGVLSGQVKKLVDSAVQKKVNKIVGSGMYDVSRVAGRGSYTVSNAMIHGGSTNAPIVMGGGDEVGATIFEKSEYVADIFVGADSGFYNTAYPINPGLTSLFPWLSQVAANYTQYELVQCILEYRPVVSSSSTSGQMGTVILCTNYNAGEPAFNEKSEMMTYQSSISGRVCDNIRAGVECDYTKIGSLRKHYVRAGPVPSGQDVKTYDYGLFQIATTGINTSVFASGSQLGMLWIHYKVKCTNPRLYDSVGYALQFDAFASQGDLVLASTRPLSHNVDACINNTLGGTFVNAGNVYTFPDQFVGYVEVIYYSCRYGAGSQTLPTGIVVAPAGNVTATTLATDGPTLDYTPDDVTWAIAASNAAYGADAMFYVGYFKVTKSATAGGNKLTITITIGGNPCKFARLMIKQVNPEMYGPSYSTLYASV